MYIVTFVTFCCFLLSALRYKFYAFLDFLTCGFLSSKKKQVEDPKKGPVNEEVASKKAKSIQEMSSLVISRRKLGKPISISKRMRKASLGFAFEGQGGAPGNNFSIISPIKFGRKNSQDGKGG